MIEGVVQPEIRTPGPFKILGIEHDPDQPLTTVAWQSAPDATYTVERSFNLVDWIDLLDDIPSQGEVTFFEDPEVLNAQQYYRVKE